MRKYSHAALPNFCSTTVDLNSSSDHDVHVPLVCDLDDEVTNQRDMDIALAAAQPCICTREDYWILKSIQWILNCSQALWQDAKTMQCSHALGKDT